MPFPAGLKFRDRLADRDGVFYFDCYRAAEHPASRPRFREAFRNRADREIYVRRHDVLHHDVLLASELRGEEASSPTLGEIVLTYLQQIERAVQDGDADHKTLTFYAGISRRLLAHLGAETPAGSIDTERVMRYDRERRAASATRGALIKKEISGLGTMMRAFGVAPAWVLGRGAIRSKKRQRFPIGAEKILRFIAAMDEASLERDFAILKLATGMRNEELYAANVGDVHLADRELEYRLRNKQGEITQHVTYLGDVALEVICRRARGPSHAPLFAIGGRRLTYTSLRKRFLAASERATAGWREEDPHAPEIRISSIGQFRHEAATEVLARLNDVRVVQQQYAHRTQLTTEQRYILGNRKAKVANSRRFVEAMDEMLEPLKDEGGVD